METLCRGGSRCEASRISTLWKGSPHGLESRQECLIWLRVTGYSDMLGLGFS
jgi:hypothetical protein